ncbi:MAG: hypothetical protein EOO00_03670, partial [Chitinophagaceae bacterium]
NILWGQKGNFLDVPTDCPQRDERLGWTGDAQAFIRTACYNMDVQTFFIKWLKDVSADQLPNGGVPFVVPDALRDQGVSAGWGDVALIGPWTIYLTYGNKKILADQYESMKKYVEYIRKIAGESYIWKNGSVFGDWLFYKPALYSHAEPDGYTNNDLIATAFFAYSTSILKNTAAVLGNTADVTEYTALLAKIKAAFNKEYVTPAGRIFSDSQTGYVLALMFDLLPEDKRPAAAALLVKDISNRGTHLSTGFLGTPYLCHVLSRFGYTDVAYKLLLQETYPSWLYPVKMGATTIWERWNGMRTDSTFEDPGMNSFNHYAYGAIGDWMYRTVAGLDTEEDQPGYKKIKIQPHIGGNFSYTNASLNTSYGKLSSNWKLDNGKILMDAEIPANTTATVFIPTGNVASVTENGKPLSYHKDIKVVGSGKEYVSNEVVLHVSKTPNIRQTDAAKKMHDNDDELLHEGEDLDKKVNDNMVLRLETDKKEVYVGEPVVAGFKLYSRLRSSSRLTKNPSFNGFSVIDLQPPDVTASGSGKLNGKDFNVYTVRKVLLYPLQSGTFTIEELELENQVQFIQPGPPEDPDDLFSLLNPGYESTISKLATLTSEPVDIVVKPLPTRNKPSNFTGAVGKYKITSHLAQNNFQADEEGRLIVEISGQGNLQLVNAPPIQWPSGIEAFDPSVKDTMDTKVLPVSGKKTFEYVFSATRPGSYEIPAVTFSYFDAEAGRYVNTESDAMMITVSPSQKAIDKASVQKAETKRDSNNFIWFLIPGAIGAIALLFFIFRNLRREQKIIEPKDEQVGAPKQTSLVSESPLERSSQLCSEGDSKKFYPVLNHEFKSWLMAKFCLQVNEASLDHLRECMDEANVQNKLVLEVQDLLREIEWQLY